MSLFDSLSLYYYVEYIIDTFTTIRYTMMMDHGRSLFSEETSLFPRQKPAENFKVRSGRRITIDNTEVGRVQLFVSSIVDFSETKS